MNIFNLQKRIKKSDRGFTLIELVLYVSIVGLVITGISAFFLNIQNTKVKNQAIANVEAQGSVIAEILNRSIASAVNIIAPSSENNNGPVLSLVQTSLSPDGNTFVTTSNSGDIILFPVPGNSLIASFIARYRVTNVGSSDMDYAQMILPVSFDNASFGALASSDDVSPAPGDTTLLPGESATLTYQFEIDVTDLGAYPVGDNVVGVVVALNGSDTAGTVYHNIILRVDGTPDPAVSNLTMTPFSGGATTGDIILSPLDDGTLDDWDGVYTLTNTGGDTINTVDVAPASFCINIACSVNTTLPLSTLAPGESTTLEIELHYEPGGDFPLGDTVVGGIAVGNTDTGQGIFVKKIIIRNTANYFHGCDLFGAIDPCLALELPDMNRYYFVGPEDQIFHLKEVTNAGTETTALTDDTVVVSDFEVNQVPLFGTVPAHVNYSFTVSSKTSSAQQTFNYSKKFFGGENQHSQ